jgi:hypothetical protein
MFVDRVFRDINIFKHSLKSNIEFVKKYINNETINGELEFFDD